MAVYYGLTGMLSAFWGATLPATDARLDLGAARLGVLLTVLAVGALLAMPIAGRVAERWTGQRLLQFVSPAASLALIGPALVPSFESLLVSAFVLGMLLGAVNVALSVQAVAVERTLERPIMATMHGVWTLGAVAGGALISQGLRIGLAVQFLMVAGAATLALIGFAVGPKLRVPHGSIATPQRKDDESRGPVPPAAVLRPVLMVVLGLVGSAAFVTEGAATDWAGVHATRVLGADPATGSLVYTVFFAAMTLVRFVGDAVRARLGAPTTIRLAGGTAVIGYGLVLLAGVLPGSGSMPIGCAMAGWALAGGGTAMVWPIVISTLGSVAGNSRRLSTVTAISYGGGLIGPAVIGYVATVSNLPTALLIPAALALAVAAVAPMALRAVVRPHVVDEGQRDTRSARAQTPHRGENHDTQTDRPSDLAGP
jgi:MFS family permease